MKHSDPDVLAGIAMGETDVSAGDLRHVESCDECAREIRSLRRVTELARSGAAEEPLLRPDDAVWSRISQTLGLAADVIPDSVSPLQAAPVAELRRPRAVRRESPRRRRAWVLPVAIAASVALVAGVAGAIALTRSPSPSVLAEVELDPLPEWSGSSGDARVEQAGDGSREVLVSLQASAAASGSDYREVWLISADLTKLVSVGVMTGDEGSFMIPDGVDLAQYPIVDISEEKLDGDPAHSGESIVRGRLDA